MNNTKIRRVALHLLLAACLMLSAPLPAWAHNEPLAESPYDDAPITELSDGSYLIDATLEGGSGRASISSPLPLDVKDGRAVATLTWSSPHYDYMVVAGKRYLPINQEGNSTFVIPVLALDERFSLIGDTTAMSQPHEIEYKLCLDTASLRAAAPRDRGATPLVWAGAVLVPLGVGILIVRQRHRH